MTDWNRKFESQILVLRILPNHCSDRGSSSRSTLLVVRDDEMTAVVCCWDFTSVVRANSLHVRNFRCLALLFPFLADSSGGFIQFGDYIEIQYADIRVRPLDGVDDRILV